MSTANPNVPFPAPPQTPSTFIGAIYEFVKGQPFNNVLMLILLGGLGAIGYGAYVSIPVHLKTIQQGYKEVAEENQKGLTSLLEGFKSERSLDREHQKQMLDLIIKNKVGSSEPRE